MTKKGAMFCLFKAVLLAYILTGFMILGGGYISYRMDLSDQVLDYMVMFIYVSTNMLAGIYIGKRLMHKRYIWGMLAGISYAFVLVIISLLLPGGSSGITLDGMCAILLCLAGGSLGGMIS